ncbi:MAG: hypothetical protein E7244_18680 [Enterocloster citroniae]|nr:hypothetical protein [Enterocloster citroniae]
MNSKKFSEAMGELDSKYVDEAINYKKKAKKPSWVKWGAMAACLCLIAVAVIIVPSMLNPQESEDGGGGTIVGGDQIILQAAPVLFAEQSVIDAIKQDMADQDIENWAEVENATLDLKCVVPIYSTANVTKDSHTILETLSFDNKYLIPVMSNDECIGTVTVVHQENKWVIFVYQRGFNLKTEVDKNKDTATCVVEVIQLNGRGFLISTDTEEFVSIPGFGISENMSGEELLNRILDNTRTSNDTDG